MDKKLKIAIGTEAFPPTIDGISTVAKCYADIINKNLGEAVIVTPKNPNQEDYKYPYKIYRYKSLFTFGEGYPVGWPFKRKFSDDIISMGFDILHSHCPIATSYFFRRVNRIKRIPQILTYHTKYEYDFERRIPGQPLKRRAYGMLLNNIKCADEVWVTSRGTAESLRKVGYTGDYIIMPNGCDLPISRFTDDDKQKLRAKYNIPPDIPLLIFVGRMMWYKNIKIIADACKILKNKNIDFRILMVGMGPDENSVKKYFKKINIYDISVFTGQILNRNELQLCYSAADLLFFPSKFDTNGLVVREAAASATASLLVKDSCASEGIADCETGFLCDENSESAAACIAKHINNKPLLNRVGLNAQNDIYISWEESIENAYERYKTVIDKFYSEGKNNSQYKY
ncbi:MAG: glycosyltransferase [Clostridiales bacterium]|nr:glycosyltransferase [Clostridiales bacterium]